MDMRTYEGLKAAVKDYLGRNDLDAQIPAFIAMAELRMNRELRLRVMERRSTAEVPAGQSSVPLPWRRTPGNWDVFMEMRDVSWMSNPPVNLRYFPVDDYAAKTSGKGLPRQYTIVGRDLFLAPMPDAGGKLLLTYFAEIPPLGEQQPFNDVLLTCPDVYLYAALVESGPYTRGSAPVELWTEYYAAAKMKIQEQEERARFTANVGMTPEKKI